MPCCSALSQPPKNFPAGWKDNRLIQIISGTGKAEVTDIAFSDSEGLQLTVVPSDSRSFTSHCSAFGNTMSA